MDKGEVAEFGSTLVLAPHPDDETIGCGGLIALLGSAGLPVHVVLMSDGTGSHRHSLTYPAARLCALRAREMVAALGELGQEPDCLSTLQLSDGAIPWPCEPASIAVVGLLTRIVGKFGPDTVVLPSRHDAHPDHQATHALGRAACAAAAPQARLLEYPVWNGSTEEAVSLQIDIASVLHNKRRALAQHRSQLGQVIHDDPQGFTLPPELLARCNLPFETYFETTTVSAT